MNQGRNISIAVIFILIFTILVSCHKTKSNNSPKHFPIDPRLNGLLFDSGTYWVYDYPLGKFTDTETIYHVATGLHSPGIGNDFSDSSFDTWYMFAYSSHDKLNSVTEICGNYWWKNYNINAIYFAGLADTTVHYFTGKKSIIDTISIAGKLFRNVSLMHVYKDPDHTTADYEKYWIHDSCGIIKWQEIKTGSIYDEKNIKSFNIIRKK